MGAWSMSANSTAGEHKCLPGHRDLDECPTKKQMGNRANEGLRATRMGAFWECIWQRNTAICDPLQMVLSPIRRVAWKYEVGFWWVCSKSRQQTVCKVERVSAIGFGRWFDYRSGLKSLFVVAPALTWKACKKVSRNEKWRRDRYVFSDYRQSESKFFQFRNMNWLRIIRGRIGEIEKKWTSHTVWYTHKNKI